MKILLTRPEPDATATAGRLVELGYECLSLPATEIVATGNPLPEGSFTAVLATSANAFRMMVKPDIARLKSAALHCVGAKTAGIAHDLGFSSAHVAGGSGAKLVSDLMAAYSNEAHFLYLTGTPRKPIVEDELRQAGYRVTSVELYKAQAVSIWPGEKIDDLATVDTALHFSRASVETLIDLAERSGTLSTLTKLRHLCLSEDVASPLRAIHCPSVTRAMEANEKSLFDLIARALP